jgi:ABC-2 type transport system permease protein
MSEVSTIKSARPSNSGEVAPLLPMLWRQVRVEFFILLRTPTFSIMSLILPILLFAFVGMGNHGIGDKLGGVSVSNYVLASYATYGVVYVMLYSFGTKVGVERSQRVGILMRATPLPPLIQVLAKILTALAFTLLMLLCLAVFAVTYGKVNLSASTWVILIARMLLGAVPFIALGTFIGYRFNPTAVSPIISIAFFLMAFASGIFVPLSQLPSFVQQVASYLPMYWLAQLGWNAVGAQTTAIGTDVFWLLVYGLVFIAAAILAFWRNEQQTFA